MAQTVDIYGLTHETTAAHADLNATCEALRMAGLADATWPNTDRRMTELYSELLIDHCLNFAISARRHLSVQKAKGVKVPDLSGRLPKRLKIDSFDGTLWRALQIIIHSQSIMVISIEVGSERFGNARDQRVCYIKVAEDADNEVHICPYGLAHAYLGRHGRTNPNL